MRWYKADLHIHTVLSPCGGLDMSPVNIVKYAASKGIDIIAITDHNSTRHCRLAGNLGEKYGVSVIPGVEVNTKEEVHCLAFFENFESCEFFQHYIDSVLPSVPNKPEIFGEQLIVDEQENIIGEEHRLLITALNSGINEVENQVHRLGGIFIPAHINRTFNGIYNQLGFIPEELHVDGLEVSVKLPEWQKFLYNHPETSNYSIISSSDAHTLEQTGNCLTGFYIEKPVFSELNKALNKLDNRDIKILL